MKFLQATFHNNNIFCKKFFLVFLKGVINILQQTEHICSVQFLLHVYIHETNTTIKIMKISTTGQKIRFP